ncbi:MAG: PilZ domain-containing protein [Magnetococcales bacterium]|nr:PilZ domain-containing protein [Magnetococcales bacterium]
MSEATTDKKTARDDKRISFRAKLRFEADHDDIVISGETKNVSMSGAFLETKEPLTGLKDGDEGVVFVEMNERGKTFDVSFHCVVARLKPGYGIAFNFESEVEEEDDHNEEEW